MLHRDHRRMRLAKCWHAAALRLLSVVHSLSLIGRLPAVIQRIHLRHGRHQELFAVGLASLPTLGGIMILDAEVLALPSTPLLTSLVRIRIIR